jgi:hypothetical protein
MQFGSSGLYIRNIWQQENPKAKLYVGLQSKKITNASQKEKWKSILQCEMFSYSLLKFHLHLVSTLKNVILSHHSPKPVNNSHISQTFVHTCINCSHVGISHILTHMHKALTDF